MYNTQMLNLTFKRFGVPKSLFRIKEEDFFDSINDELQNLLGTEHRMTSCSVPPTDKWVGGEIQPHSPKLFAEGGQ